MLFGGETTDDLRQPWHNKLITGISYTTMLNKMKTGNYYINQNSGDGSWSDLLGDVYSGIAVGMGHTRIFVRISAQSMMDAIASMIWIDTTTTTPGGMGMENVSAGGEGGNSHSSKSADGGAGTDRGLRVVGVGYGRTGTFSLAIALDELGFPTLVS